MIVPALSERTRASGEPELPAVRVVVAVNNIELAWAGVKTAAAENSTAIAKLIFKEFSSAACCGTYTVIVSKGSSI